MLENARKRAVDALMRMHGDQGFSNKIIDSFLSKGEWKPEDKALFSRLVYGVEERRLTIDFLLSQKSKMSLKRMHPCVIEALRIGVYQLLFMEKIPPSAAVNESVKIVRSMHQEKATGLTNAILRAILRDCEAAHTKNVQVLLSNTQKKDNREVLYSCPNALINLWQESYGNEMTNAILETINKQPPAVIRINTMQSSDEEFEAFATNENIHFHKMDYLEHAYVIDAQDELRLRKWNGTKWYYQDAASQLCVASLEANEGLSVIDVCAAPGGKSLGVAQKMRNVGEIISTDIYPQKCDDMQKRAEELGITILRSMPRDASKPCPKQWLNKFDRVLCDVPCSGFGVIRRRPEIRYHDMDEAAQLPKIQYAILEESSKMVKPGGYLQYSTCTLNRKENEDLVEHFLKMHSEFQPRILPIAQFFEYFHLEESWKITLFPHLYDTDGFFIAGFQKVGE